MWRPKTQLCELKHFNMADLKTQKTGASVQSYLNALEPPQRKKDCQRIHAIMQEVSGFDGSMWGTDIVGYGSYHYIYDSGREGDWMLTGFSNRKQSISIYLMSGFDVLNDQLQKLGKYKTGKSCLYIQKLDDIDTLILKEMIRTSINIITNRYK